MPRHPAPAFWRPLAATALAAIACMPAGAQVHRCGDAAVYTDKPCANARPVDLRANIMNAGPRFIPKDEPTSAVIPAGATQAKNPEGSGGDVWQRRQAREAEHRMRTGPYAP